jgi:8-amino-7-oxononanoate synthase
MIDDAHGLMTDPAPEADIQMGTLSKAAGSYGGYVCARSEVIALFENKARTLLFATGLPPTAVAAATAALSIMKENPQFVQQPLENARRFTSRLGREPAMSPIVPVIVGSPAAALEAATMLEAHGYLVVPIRPPSVPAGTARLRFAFTALHQADDIERVAALLKENGYA